MMKPVFAAIVTAVLAASALAAAAGADTFVVAGAPMPSPSPFEVLADKQEVCAPAAAALRRLGVEITASGADIVMRAPNGSTVSARLGSDRAVVGGVERVLPAPLSRQGDNLYLPVRAIAWRLDLAYRWDEASRTIFLHPRVAPVTLLRLPDKLRIKITGSAGLSYSAGVLKEPARIYVDIANADLFAAEQQIAANEGDLIAIRASQNCLNPDMVRVVLDLKQEPAQYYHSAADGGRSIVIDLPAPQLPPPTPGVVTVGSVRLEPRSDSMCALLMEGNGTPVASLFSRRDPPQIVVELSNAQLKPEEVEGTHPLVESASAEVTGENEGRIVVNLKSAQPAALARRPDGVCVLIGRVPLREVTVVLDAGHGDRMVGASGASGLEEKGVNLAVAFAAEKLLKEMGVKVVLTRRGDSRLMPVNGEESRVQELTMRAEVANSCKADLFIAIHSNAGGAGQRGTETYYCTARSLEVAKIMQEEMVKALQRKNGGVRQRDDLRVLRVTHMPSVLLELAYLTDPEEEALLGSPEFRQRAAGAIAAGVQRYAEEGALLDYYAEVESAKWKSLRPVRPVASSRPVSEAKPGPAPADKNKEAAGTPAPLKTAPSPAPAEGKASTPGAASKPAKPEPSGVRE